MKEENEMAKSMRYCKMVVICLSLLLAVVCSCAKVTDDSGGETEIPVGGDSLLVGPTRFELSQECQTLTLQLRKNLLVDVAVSTDAESWIHARSGDVWAGLAVFDIDANDTKMLRQGEIKISEVEGSLCETVTVVQNPVSDVFPPGTPGPAPDSFAETTEFGLYNPEPVYLFPASDYQYGFSYSENSTFLSNDDGDCYVSITIADDKEVDGCILAKLVSKGIVIPGESAYLKVISEDDGMIRLWDESLGVGYVLYWEDYVPISSVRVEPEALRLVNGTKQQLSYQLVPDNATNIAVSWQSSNPSVADVSETGLVTAKAVGSAVITVESVEKGIKSECVVSVVIPVVSLHLDEKSVVMMAGDKKRMGYELKPDDATEKDVVWRSSDESVVTVSPGGELCAVAPGDAEVYVETADGTIGDDCMVMVIPKTDGVELDRKSADMTLDDVLQLTATLSPGGQQNNYVRWASSDESVLVVSASGLVTPKRTGNASVTVSVPGTVYSSSCAITVHSEKLSISSASLSIFTGQEARIHASLAYSDGTERIVMSSNNPSVASVMQDGTVRGVSAGSAVITAAVAGTQYRKSCSVTVVYSKSLSESGTANCYVVPSAGNYRFRASVRGNGHIPVGDVRSADVLWESSGQQTSVYRGAVISDAFYSSGYVFFSTPSALRDGNAVIAVKDDSGKVLWSWHIWACAGYDPDKTMQTYIDGTGYMMDRNLGAVSASPGNVGSLGLLYQWGRKDPFPGSAAIAASTTASTTIPWPQPVSADSSAGNMGYAAENPAVFLTTISDGGDWCGDDSTIPYGNSRWSRKKTAYDPCPVGWRIPDGGDDGVWVTLAGTQEPRKVAFTGNKGMNLGTLKSGNVVFWYPAAGYKSAGSGILTQVGSVGYYWTSVSEGGKASVMSISSDGSFAPLGWLGKACGCSVRCQRIVEKDSSVSEGTGENDW